MPYKTTGTCFSNVMQAGIVLNPTCATLEETSAMSQMYRTFLYLQVQTSSPMPTRRKIITSCNDCIPPLPFSPQQRTWSFLLNQTLQTKYGTVCLLNNRGCLSKMENNTIHALIGVTNSRVVLSGKAKLMSH